jgi:hypothetical protein
MTASTNQTGQRRRLRTFDVVLAGCLATLAMAAFVYGVQTQRSNDHFSGLYFLWGAGFLFFAGWLILVRGKNLGVTNITTSVVLLLFSIGKWLDGKSMHVLAIILVLASACFTAKAIREMREKKKSAIPRHAVIEGQPQR